VQGHLDRAVGPSLWGQRLLGKGGIPLLVFWVLLLVGGMTLSQLSSALERRRTIRAADAPG